MIGNLTLADFRNFKKKSVKFSNKITVIVGSNGTGKTNILESLFLLSTGKSFKAKLESESINYNENLARVMGESGENKLEVVLTKNVDGWPRKRVLLNGVPKRVIDFAGNFKVVLFGPWDMDLVTESPSIRRKFLDTVLSQVDREYRRSILSYDKGLRQRNRLLFNIRENGTPRTQLLFWNQLLIKTGDYVSKCRREFIEFANSGTFQLPIKDLQLEYDPSAISETRLEQYKNEEIASATTLVGPHRDDFIFKFEDRNLATYGSRGEQRMGVLWLKLAELAYVELKSGEKPTLLLDDIFSELDHEHRDVVIKVADNQQTIITTADEHFVEGFKNCKNIKLYGTND